MIEEKNAHDVHTQLLGGILLAAIISVVPKTAKNDHVMSFCILKAMHTRLQPFKR